MKKNAFASVVKWISASFVIKCNDFKPFDYNLCITWSSVSLYWLSDVDVAEACRLNHHILNSENFQSLTNLFWVAGFVFNKMSIMLWCCWFVCFEFEIIVKKIVRPNCCKKKMILEKKSWSSKENNVLFTLVCLQTNTALLSFILKSVLLRVNLGRS